MSATHGPRRPVAPAILASLVALAGLIGLASALTPRVSSRADILASAVPDPVSSASTVVTAGVSIVLLALAGSLRRRRHRAYVASLVLLLVASVLHLLKGLDVEEAFVTLALAGVLVLRRRDFDVGGEPGLLATRRRVLVLGTVAVVVVAVAIVEATSAAKGDRLGLGAALRAAGIDLMGGDSPLTGPRVELLLSIEAVALLLLATWAWLGPRREDRRGADVDRLRVRHLVEEHAGDSLAYFALRRDRRYVFSPCGRAAVAYRPSHGVALAGGDPVGDPAAAGAAIEAFVETARARDLRPCAIGVSDGLRDAWAEAGLRTLYVGDEAVVEPGRFSLEGRAIRKVRQSCTRLERLGYRVEITTMAELSPGRRGELTEVSRDWLETSGGEERGFSMALDDMWAPEHGGCVVAIGLDEADTVGGFVHLVPSDGGHGLSLSAMRRRPDAPNGLTEFLLCRLFEWGRDHGIERVSLNFNAFAAILRADEAPTRGAAAMRWVLGKADRAFQIERLLRFNEKFHPTLWQPRYAAFERSTDIPQSAFAVLVAEGLLKR